jgi:hypothetical protein
MPKQKKQRRPYYRTTRRDLVLNNIRPMRLAKGYKSQNALAKACGLPSQTINRLESFKLAWTYRSLSKIAQACNCQMRDLI